MSSNIISKNKSKTEDNIASKVIKILAFISVIVTFFIIVFVFKKAFPILKESGIGLLTKSGFDAQINEAFYASSSLPMFKFGMKGIILGTLVTTLFSVILATIIGIGMSIAICELMPRRLSQIVTSVTHLLASIPSVIFGLIGIITVVPFINKVFVNVDLQIKYLEFFQITGKSLLAAIIVLTFMIVPTVVSLTVNVFKDVPNHYKEIGYSFGMSRFRVIRKILIPCALPGIVNSVILAAGRGIGEAIAVSMVCGGLGVVPDFTRGLVAFLAPVLPLASAIVNKSEAMSSASVEAALFACAALLLMFGALLSIGATAIKKKMRKVAGYAENK